MYYLEFNKIINLITCLFLLDVGLKVKVGIDFVLQGNKLNI